MIARNFTEQPAHQIIDELGVSIRSIDKWPQRSPVDQKHRLNLTQPKLTDGAAPRSVIVAKCPMIGMKGAERCLSNHVEAVRQLYARYILTISAVFNAVLPVWQRSAPSGPTNVIRFPNNSPAFTP